MQLGRKGRGPGEWLNVGFIHATTGDSSLLDDFGNQRWLMLHGAAIVDVVPPDHPAVRATRAVIAGLDRYDHILQVQSPPRRPGVRVITRADSNTVVFINRRTGAMDTIAKIRERPHRREIAMDAQGRVTRDMPSATEPNAQGEFASLFPDGWLAIVRLDPLRVDWRAPNGTWTRGAPFTLRPEPVNAADRRAIEQRRTVAKTEAKRYGLPAPTTADFPTTWPVLAPLWPPKQSSDGRLLLRRSTSAASPGTRYLVINRRGTVDGELVLGPNEDIIGFGPRSAYVAFTDEDDIQRLRRHPWPSAR
jgi:hypothetical protein